MAISKVATLCWVSEPRQHTDNQLGALTAWAVGRGFEVAVTYEFQELAWKGAPQKQLSQIYQDARTGKPQVLLVWSLATLDIVHRLGHWGVQVWSNREPWTEVGGELLDLFLAIVGWVATMESNRRSERAKFGLRRAVSQGKRLGRPPGSKARRKCSKRSYLLQCAD